MGRPRGSGHGPGAKALEIQRRLKAGERQVDIARETGLSRQRIQQIASSIGIRQRHQQARDSAVESRIELMRSWGMSFVEIGKVLEVSKGVVAGLVFRRRLGQ